MVLRGAMICNITIVHHQSSFSWHSEAHWGGFSTFFCFMSLVSIKSSSIGTNELASHCTNKQKAAVRKSLFWANWLSVLELVYFWKILCCFCQLSCMYIIRSFIIFCILVCTFINPAKLHRLKVQNLMKV
jgi:hypothetical protein